MYYSFPCPKCGVLISEFENQEEGDNDAIYKLSDMVKQHYQNMHEPGDFTYTDAELNYAVQSGMTTSEEKPY